MSRRIMVFTQTYSNNRHRLFDYHDRDAVDIYFRNVFEKTVYAFHNSPADYIQDILRNHSYFQELDNLEVIRYDNMSYPESFRRTLQKCKSEGYDYMVFLQDDVFSLGEGEAATHLDDLISYIQTGDFKMLHLENYVFKFEAEPETFSAPPVVHDNGAGFKVFANDSKHFEVSGQWAMDDGPFVAHIDFLLELFDAKYFTFPTIWPAEGYINEKVKLHPIVRYSASHKFFRRYNAVGPNDWNKVQEFGELDRLFSPT